MSSPLHYVYNALTGTFDLTGGGGSSSAITNITATDAGSSVSFDITGTVANLELTDAQFNTVLGEGSGVSLAGGIKNTVLGYNSLNTLTVGSGNLVLGNDSGNSLTGAEDNNILLASTGITGVSNAIILGNNSHTSFYAFGIANVLFTDFSTRALCIDPGTSEIGWKTFTDGFANTFLGNNAGNAALAGISNSGFGQQALQGLITGNQNCAFGNGAMTNCDNSSLNSAFGYFALANMTQGQNNTAVGWAALGGSGTEFNNCTAVGVQSLAQCTGDNNVAVGFQSASGLDTGINNTVLGASALGQLLTGDNNVALGRSAGFNYTTSESGNICIGNLGTLGESNVTRIGTSQTEAYIAGINGATVTGSAVLCATDGKLGTVVSSARYKENIEDMEEEVSILNLRTVKFNYKKDDKKITQYGLIAEDVHEKFPYLCLYNRENEPETLKYHEICTFLLHEMKKMDKRIKDLEIK